MFGWISRQMAVKTFFFPPLHVQYASQWISVPEVFINSWPWWWVFRAHRFLQAGWLSACGCVWASTGPYRTLLLSEGLTPGHRTRPLPQTRPLLRSSLPFSLAPSGPSAGVGYRHGDFISRYHRYLKSIISKQIWRFKMSTFFHHAATKTQMLMEIAYLLPC